MKKLLLLLVIIGLSYGGGFYGERNVRGTTKPETLQTQAVICSTASVRDSARFIGFIRMPTGYCSLFVVRDSARILGFLRTPTVNCSLANIRDTARVVGFIRTPLIRDSVFYSDSGFVNILRAKSGGSIRIADGDTLSWRDVSKADSFLVQVTADSTIIRSDNPIAITGSVINLTGLIRPSYVDIGGGFNLRSNYMWWTTTPYSMMILSTGDTLWKFIDSTQITNVLNGSRRRVYNLETNRESLALGTGSTVIADTIKSANILPQMVIGQMPSVALNAVTWSTTGDYYFQPFNPTTSMDSIIFDSCRVVAYFAADTDSIDSLVVKKGVSRSAYADTVIYREPTNWGAGGAGYVAYTYPVATTILPTWRQHFRFRSKSGTANNIEIYSILCYGHYK